jgi:hypothetical protein
MDELGYFAFGGSTLVVLTRPDVLELDADLLVNADKRVRLPWPASRTRGRSARGADLLSGHGPQLETLVRVGDSIGRVRKP